MKRKHLALLGLIPLLALTACDGGVSAQQFKEEAAKVEAHTYSEATVKYEIDINMILVSDKGTGEITYTCDDKGNWTTTSTDKHAENLAGQLTANLADFDPQSEMSADDIPEGIKFEVKYYINPFKVIGSIDGTYEEDGVNTTMKGASEFRFDQYGYCTYYLVDINTEASMPSLTMRTKLYTKLEISYK